MPNKAKPLDAETAEAINKILAALRRERIARGITIELLASRLKVGVPKLSMMERCVDLYGDQANPIMSFVARWARALELELRLVVEVDSLDLKPRKAEWSKLSKDEQRIIGECRGKIPAGVLAERYKVSKTTIYNTWIRYQKAIGGENDE